MFDVTTARQIQYQDTKGNDLNVTVFQDRTDKGLWYLVPVPRLRIQSGEPVFNLTKYTSNGGGVAGVCTFETELYAPSEAKVAAQEQIPEITAWGQFTWVSGDASFNYDIEENGIPTSQKVIISPSLFDTNAARFQIELESEAALNSFVEAFTGEGSLSPFSVTYSMGVLTELLGAKATIKFSASAAINYERSYTKTTDTWGNEKQVLASVKQNLVSSGAGDVKVEKGVGGTNELVQMVRDWAWSRLETQIAQAIESAQDMAKGNENPISVLSDIDITYAEDAIIEWSTPVAHQLPRFDAEDWAKVYQEVDNRQLVVTFELVGMPVNEDGDIPFRDVEVTVDYPTRVTENSFRLAIENSGNSDRPSVTYRAPGMDPYNPKFKYKYTVNYDDAPPYTSDWIETSETRVQFNPARLGTRNVTFTGSGIPFVENGNGTVKNVFIDFYEKPPAGQPSKSQTKVMKKNSEDIVFLSTYHVPITNTYRYRLRYQLTNNKVVTIQPEAAFGSANADQIFVVDPEKHDIDFKLMAMHDKDGESFLSININAGYEDIINSGQSRSVTHDWNNWVPEFGDKTPSVDIADPWKFKALADPQTACFKIDGTVIYGDGDMQSLKDIYIPYSQKPLILYDNKYLYTVKIIPTQIDWEKVQSVTVNLFQRKAASNGGLTDILECTALVDSIQNQQPSLPDTKGSTTNFVPYYILQPEDPEKKSLPRYYALYRLRSSDKIEFFYNAEYEMKDGKTRSIDEAQITDKLQLILPDTASEPSGKIHHISLDVARSA